jgi:hypothetical protein
MGKPKKWSAPVVHIVPAAIVGRTVEIRAPRRHAVVLGDLRRYITEMDQAGAPDSTPLKGRHSPWRGWLTVITAFAVREKDLSPDSQDWDRLALASPTAADTVAVPVHEWPPAGE